MRSYTKKLALSVIKIPLSALVLTILIPSVSIAATLNTLKASWSSSSGADVDSGNLSSTTGPLSFTSSQVAGSSDFGVLRAESRSSNNYVSGTSGTGPSESGGVTARTNFSVFVDAAPPPIGGGSGLVFGDSVSLDVSFRLDGNLFASATSGRDTTGSASMRASLRIEDPNIELDCGSPDGCYTPKLLDFDANASVESYGSTGSTNYSFYGWGWDLTTRDGLDNVIASQSDDGFAELQSYSFNTGILSASIDTTIGAQLDVSGFLSTFAQAWYGASGTSDFMDTFGAVFTPTTEGVLLDYGDITPASYDLGGGSLPGVPVPASIWLFASGLIGLISVARRS